MRRATPLAAIVLLLLAVACGAKTQKHEDTRAHENTLVRKQARAREQAAVVANIRASVPAIEAYWSDNNTYSGMSRAKLRDIDPGIADLSIASARWRTYCIEAIAGESRAFKNGPAAEIMLGSCSDPKNGKHYDTTSPEDSSSSTAPPDATTALRASLAAIEAYHMDHNTYSGMTVSKLRKIDQGFPALKIVSAKKESYCVEITVDGASSFAKSPPIGNIKQGHCPA